jgi:hypothetical protein
MQLGDIVKIEDWKGSNPDARKHGKVLRIAGHHRWASKKSFKSRKEGLAEVLWQDGAVGWVSTSRLGKVCAG